MTLSVRTRKQETKYNQALGYGWGAKDASKWMTAPADQRIKRLYLRADVLAFAAFYAVDEEKVQAHVTVEHAWEYFVELRLDEQKAYGTQWATLPY